MLLLEYTIKYSIFYRVTFLIVKFVFLMIITSMKECIKMTTQKIANILYGNGYIVSKNSDSYISTYYTVRYNNEIIFSCKGSKDLKDWFNIMNSRYNFKTNGIIPEYNLDGIKQ